MKTFAKIAVVMCAFALCSTQMSFAQNGKKIAQKIGQVINAVQQGQQQQPPAQKLVQPPAQGFVQPPAQECIQPPQQGYVAPPMPQPPVRLGFSGTMTCEGMRVVQVQYGSYAQQIGLEPGDIITHINGKKVRDLYTYQNLLRWAVDYNHGHVNLRIKNVRANWDPYAPTFVTRHLDLPHNDYLPAGGTPVAGL